MIEAMKFFISSINTLIKLLKENSQIVTYTICLALGFGLGYIYFTEQTQSLKDKNKDLQIELKQNKGLFELSEKQSTNQKKLNEQKNEDLKTQTQHLRNNTASLEKQAKETQKQISELNTKISKKEELLETALRKVNAQESQIKLLKSNNKHIETWSLEIAKKQKSKEEIVKSCNDRILVSDTAETCLKENEIELNILNADINTYRDMISSIKK